MVQAAQNWPGHGVAESVVIAAPIAAVVYFAGGGTAVAAGLRAIGTRVATTAALTGPLGATYGQKC